jgi:hypothetical protein
VLKLSYVEFRDQPFAFKNALSPDSLKRDFPAFILDVGKPLGPGLRSFAKVVNGTFTIASSSIPLPGSNLVGMISHLQDGAVERVGDQIVASLRMEGPQKQHNDLVRSLGLDVFEIVSSESELSSDHLRPTTFSSPLDWLIPRGAPIYSPIHGATIPCPMDLSIKSSTTARGFLKGRQFVGVVTVEYLIAGFPSTIKLTGEFDMTLS